ncbi:TetR family transcriptional regulator [Mycobacterium sp. 852013-50091_SCH5140682]|uniref:TetR/AcrR family transcriptional regulator n=1 Tax=Mycobacterium sp. 852013-50091_SCH5140682 TaxID=1834109 RepID=UPI0007EA48F0|nr:TetR family transcriptional regulator [Mycobacterium sp. 852013-50091_SCH5140682]OBC00994.1 TetR family transcriptional regulator [Mycobacterium sp. 852013-50091_SCH5140682]
MLWTPRSAAQTRILDAALELIAEHGVSGTSLQMIADAISVTKAAVYHQFKTKEAIVIALTERELGQLEDALEAAEAQGSPMRAREVLLTRVIEMTVARRRAASTLQFDPVVVRLLADHQPFQQFIDRLYAALLGGGSGTTARVHAAMLSGVISVAVMHPLVADIDDDTLRTELLQTMRRIVALPA